MTRDTIWLSVVMGTDPNARFPLTRRKTSLSSEVICLIWNTQASTNWGHCFTFSEGLVDDWVEGVTSFLSYYKITLSIGLASGTERATYRFTPACRLCRIKKRFCICSMSFVDCYRGSFVSLRNRTADRRGRQNACLWQTWQGHYLRVMSWSSQNINVFWSLQKNICLKESEVWRKVISNKIIVTLVTQGLPSSFFSRTVA